MLKSTLSMSRYKHFNLNPVNNINPDCTIRAIGLFTDSTWTETYDGVCAEGRRMYNMPSSNVVWSSYLRKLGFRRYLLKNTCPDCYTVREFCFDHPNGRFLLCLDEHVVTVIDGYYYDTFDCGNETVLYYWC